MGCKVPRNSYHVEVFIFKNFTRNTEGTAKCKHTRTQIKIFLKYVFKKKRQTTWELPGGLALEIWHLHYCRLCLVSDLGTEIAHQASASYSQKQ